MEVTVSAKKSCQAKKKMAYITRIVLTFFLNNTYFAKFSKVVYTEFIGIHSECKKSTKKATFSFCGRPKVGIP